MVRSILPQASTRLFEEIDAARAYLDRHETDLLLLDLNLNGRDGFGLLREWVACSFQTIVVSANADRAIEAFEYGVLDFVPKPVCRERLEKALLRASEFQGPAPTALRYFSVRHAGSFRLIEASDVLYLRGAGKYSELVLRDGSTVLHDKSLEQLSLILGPTYSRIHKSYLVELANIEKLKVQRGGKYQAILRSGHRLPVGRSRYVKLRDALI